MKINITLTKNNGETWEGSPSCNVLVPNNLSAKDIDYIARFLGVHATDELNERSVDKEKAEAVRRDEEEQAKAYITRPELELLLDLVNRLRPKVQA